MHSSYEVNTEMIGRQGSVSVHGFVCAKRCWLNFSSVKNISKTLIKITPWKILTRCAYISRKYEPCETEKWSLSTNFKDHKNQNTTHNLSNNGKAFLCRECYCVAEIQLHCLVFKFRNFDQFLKTVQGYHKAVFLTKELVSLFAMPVLPSNLVLNIAALRPSKWASIITVCACSHVQTLTWKSFPGIKAPS